MSLVLNGKVTDTELSKNARGGTEMMRDRLLKYVNPELLENVAVHFSRSEAPVEDAINIFYAHDLAQDPANKVLLNEGWREYDHFVFVSHWQRDQYLLVFGIPQDITTVIHNAIEDPLIYPPREHDGVKRFIYHTTPHRGLELLFPIIDQLSAEYKKDVHLDVFSSFSIYGWEQRDEPYKELFKAIGLHPNMTYHGARPNGEVLKALAGSNYFLYPCIWRETSCIALIEAMAHGVIGIVPDLAGLPETALLGPSFVYDWTSEPQEHMNRAYTAAKQVLEAGDFQINRYVAESYTPKSRVLNVNHFAVKWSILLATLRAELLEDAPAE